MKSPPLSKPDPTHFTQRVGELRQSLLKIDPFRLAHNTGASFTPGDNQHGEFHLSMWSRLITISFPEFIAHQTPDQEELPLVNQALLLYYFTTADGAPLTGRWTAFSELPNGRFYTQAFQGYTGSELQRSIGNDQPGFERVSERLGGLRQPLGDASFAFQALPRVPVLIVFWKGDEEFPSTFQVLFDGSASHYLPTDAFAILGSALAHRLLAAYHSPA